MPAYGARDTAAAAGVPATSYQGAEGDNVPPTLQTNSSTRRVFSAVALSAVALAGAAFASGRVSGGASGVSLLDAYSHSDAVPPPGEITNEHSLFVSNELERNNGFRIGQGYLPWVYLAEVYVPTLMQVEEPKEVSCTRHTRTIQTIRLTLHAPRSKQHVALPHHICSPHTHTLHPLARRM
jgi:hypothetical protein